MHDFASQPSWNLIAQVHCCGLSSTLYGRFQLVVSGPMRDWAPPHVWRTQERWREQLRDVDAVGVAGDATEPRLRRIPVRVP